MIDNPIAPGRGHGDGSGGAREPSSSRSTTWHPIPSTLCADAQAQWRTGLGVPLFRGTTVIGVIFLARSRVEPFTEHEIELVTTFADQAVIAIENARLLGDLQRRTHDLQESLEYQTATSDVLKVISRSTFDLQPVLETLTETAARLCEADTANIMRREGDVYRAATAFGFSPEYKAFMESHPFPPGPRVNHRPGRPRGPCGARRGCGERSRIRVDGGAADREIPHDARCAPATRGYAHRRPSALPLARRAVHRKADRAGHRPLPTRR